MLVKYRFQVRIITISFTPTRHIHVNRNIWSFGIIHSVHDGIEINFGFPTFQKITFGQNLKFQRSN